MCCCKRKQQQKHWHTNFDTMRVGNGAMVHLTLSQHTHTQRLLFVKSFLFFFFVFLFNFVVVIRKKSNSVLAPSSDDLSSATLPKDVHQWGNVGVTVEIPRSGVVGQTNRAHFINLYRFSFMTNFFHLMLSPGLAQAQRSHL